MPAEPAPEPATSTGGAPWSCEAVTTDPMVVAVSGELDTLTGPHVQERLIAAIEGSEGPVRIEFAGVSFIDSQGLSALINVRQHFPDRSFVIADPRPNVKRLIEITGLDKAFDIT
jgi:anti-sigma B factor antagonist